MTFDAQALSFAFDLAVDRVLFDPTDADIADAVADFMGADRLSERLAAGVVYLWTTVDALEYDPSDADRKALIRSTQSLFGLC